MVKRFGLYEIKNSENILRLGVVISPDELNSVLNHVIILPLFSVITSAPFRIGIEFNGASGEIAVEHIISIPQDRLGRLFGVLPDELVKRIQEVLNEMFK